MSYLSDINRVQFDSWLASFTRVSCFEKRLSCAISWWSWGRDRQASTLAHCSLPGRLSGTLHNRNIEWFLGDQALSPSYSLAPRPTPPPPSSRQQVVSVFQYSSVYSVVLTDGKVGQEPNHTTSRKPGPLSGFQGTVCMCTKRFLTVFLTNTFFNIFSVSCEFGFKVSKSGTV